MEIPAPPRDVATPNDARAQSSNVCNPAGAHSRISDRPIADLVAVMTWKLLSFRVLCAWAGIAMYEYLWPSEDLTKSLCLGIGIAGGAFLAWIDVKGYKV
jgi:hypothetical protein